MSAPLRRGHYLSLVVLLAVQLTGLTCVDDWHDAAFSLHSADHHYAVGTQSDHATPVEDGCPCHLSFVSMPRNAHSVESPAVPLNGNEPLTFPYTDLSVPFHPPLVS